MAPAANGTALTTHNFTVRFSDTARPGASKPRANRVGAWKESGRECLVYDHWMRRSSIPVESGGPPKRKYANQLEHGCFQGTTAKLAAILR